MAARQLEDAGWKPALPTCEPKTETFESKFFHWITRKALYELHDAGQILLETMPLNEAVSIKFYRHKGHRFWRRQANEIAALVRTFSEPAFSTALGRHGELMFDAAFPTAGFMPKGRDIKTYNGKSWTQTRHNLDRIFERDGHAACPDFMLPFHRIGLPTMTRSPEHLAKTIFDLAVIGGGIQGAAVAREAALRGLKVALVEARDFGAGTSSRSSKLIHGGLRYLEQLDFKLVGEARRERQRLLRLGPHLARPVPFLLPIYEDDPYSRLKIRFGLAIYDLLGNLGQDDRHRMVTAEEALHLIPALRPEGLRAAAVYYDSRTDDARLTLENVLDAARHGAVVANHMAVRGFEASPLNVKPGVVAAEIEDRLSGQHYSLAARFWVNAAGPWVDQVRALLPGYDGSKTVRLTKGVHLIVPAITGQYALLAAIIPGDRVFLMVPWHGYALLGTTDTDFHGDPERVRVDREDTAYLIRAANRVFRDGLKPECLVGCFAGLRALVRQEGRSPSETTREYRFHEDRWARNFISICGGKLTTARALGEKLVDELVARLGGNVTDHGHPSRRLPLPGGGTGPFEAFVRSATTEASGDFGFDSSICERIVRSYGSRWREVLEPARHDPRLRELLHGSTPLTTAEVEFAIREEMAMTPEDFLLRRSGLSWLACLALRDAAPSVTAIFAERFAWGAERRAAALEDFCRLATPP